MKHFTYIGTYTQLGRGQGHRPEGIYRFLFNEADGSLILAGATSDILNPSFLAVHPSFRYLYAANELGEGKVSAFAIQPEDGALALLNSQPTGGAHPCYLSCDPGGRYLMTANYSSGSLAIYPILENGSLGACSGKVQHTGRLGPNHNRQERPHAHSIRCDPSGRFVLAADLGLDQVLVYRIDAQGALIPNDPPCGEMPPGSGPRHFEFSSDGRFVYLAGELDSTVTACAWDDQAGKISPFQTLSTLPPDFRGESTVADIHRTPGGSHLYVSNRGHDSLAIFAMDQSTGRLEAQGHAATGGRTPRNFAIDPEGRYLYAANQDSDNIVAFTIDPASGDLTPTGLVIAVGRPVCVLFVDVG
jgi:6-phosphogluconolactonase